MNFELNPTINSVTTAFFPDTLVLDVTYDFSYFRVLGSDFDAEPSDDIEAGFYYSEDTTFSEDDVLLQSIALPSDPPGARPFSETGRLAQLSLDEIENPSVDAYVLFVTDTTDVLDELDETNNTAAFRLGEANGLPVSFVAPTRIETSDFDYVEIEAPGDAGEAEDRAGNGLIIVDGNASTAFRFSWFAGGGAGDDVYVIRSAGEANISTGPGADIILLGADRDGFGTANAQLIADDEDVIIVVAEEDDVEIDRFSTPGSDGVDIVLDGSFFYRFSSGNIPEIVFLPDLDVSALPTGDLEDIGLGPTGTLVLDVPANISNTVGDGNDFVVIDNAEPPADLGDGADTAIVASTQGGGLNLGGSDGVPPSSVVAPDGTLISIPGRPAAPDSDPDVVIFTPEAAGTWNIFRTDASDKVVLVGFEDITSVVDLQLRAFQTEFAETEYRLSDTLTLIGAIDASQFVLEDDFSTVNNAPLPIIGTLPEPNPVDDDDNTDPPGNGGGNATDDTIVGTEGNDTLAGTDANEVIAGGIGDDSLSGGGGNDVISGSSGNDVINAGAGDDNVGGGEGNDTITGAGGDDTIGSGRGDDSASGGAGNDIVNGAAGADVLIGGVGNDTMGASFGNDQVDGGDGDDSMGGGTGQDTLTGGGGDDAIGAGEGNDTASGGAGNDRVNGGGRDDVLDGGAGDDLVNGGAGSDTMTGGAGTDTFIYNTFEDGDADVVTDFETGVDVFRMTGIQNAPGTGLQGRVDALAITDVAGGAQMSYEGNTILVQGVTAAQLNDLDNFMFL